MSPLVGTSKQSNGVAAMKRLTAVLLAGFAATAIASSVGWMGPTFAEEMTKMVGGAPMYPSKNIVQNAVNSKDHTTLVTAVKAAGLVDTLQSPGPFTVFAPTNDAFAKLPDGTVQTLLKPENKPLLTKILTYHVVSGRLTTNDLKKMVKDGGGKAELKTVEGAPLTIEEKNGQLWIVDAKGDTAAITISNVMQSNGVIQVINTVMLPG
jgi:uncharacterized surface protein with fasciclin (FAS1) repeats